jgi:tRNA(fMet)-specific endonuclease VapC
MKRYLLDTNIVSHLLRGHPEVSTRVQATPMAALCISAVTEGELLFGLAKRPTAGQLRQAVLEMLKRLEVLPWGRAAAAQYGSTRAALVAKGKVLAPLDLMIAAHAQSVQAVLVSNDQAFGMVDGLEVEDWTIKFNSEK